MDSYKDSKIVQQLAASGIQWAAKYRAKGWSSLSGAQKKAARTALRMPLAPQVIQPVRPRVRNPPQRGSSTGPGQAGKTFSVTRSEYICDVGKTVGATPTFTSWAINPRNVSSFPSISVCSMGYEKYKITNFKVRYSNSMSDDLSGKVAVGFTNDSSDPIPTNKTQLYQMRVTMDTAAKESKTLTIPADGTNRFLRDSSSDDAKLVDFGRVVLATYGFEESAPDSVGEIHFEYTLVFSEPNFITTLTQIGNQEASEGPTYATATLTPTHTTINLQAPGSWLVVMSSEKEALNEPKIIGDGASGTVRYLSDGQTIAVVTVNANLPGAKVDIEGTVATKGLVWYVSRL